ncbi:hypothetical protein VOLCADRAFT_87483 [Volvox carteri f. nagariensis]|uniref:Uncharacterized protein n=1 Tax=Volvox carteri f. nagariensis TaxID=3068 RepID=D8TLG3_VOLCA|nr:uncharacterized protein VOLCADRAFT_87483 [Volvox carteri f. nagariensis]EFJ51728.1 hypothetical protein VOLCADRAFT_87483 [Volvox carteri f. nagariensis]|eukprot:XP_002947138.1 hypothetical protein VOLCADRAFT_87483 [Volvox carteri f. nagariensis]
MKTVLSIRGQDVWLAAILTFWLLRVASRICLPQRMYTQFAAPFLTFAARAAPVVLLLAAGRRSPLSSAASQFILRSQGLFDAIVSLTQPAVYVHAELLFNVFNIAAVGVLASWHGRGGGGGSDAVASRVFVAQVVLQRAALMVAVHWLAGRFLHRRPSRSGGAASAGGADAVGATGGPVAAAAAAAAASGDGRDPLQPPAPPPSAVQPTQQPAHVQQLLLQHHNNNTRQEMEQERERKISEAGEGDGGSAGKPDGTDPRFFGVEGAEAEEGGPTGDGEPCDIGLDGCSSDCRSGFRARGSQPPAVEAAAAAAARAVAASEAAGGAVAEVEANGGMKNAAAAVAAVARAVFDGNVYPTMQGNELHGAPCLLPYKSPIRRRTARIKIPFAEPDQISPGYVERLQELVAQRGMHLSGVYVRPGCIELLLDLEVEAERLYDYGTAYGAAVGNALQEKDCGSWRRLPASSPGGAGGNSTAGTTAVDDELGVEGLIADLSSDMGSILQALGLSAPLQLDEQAQLSTVAVSAVPLGHLAGPVRHGGAPRPRPRIHIAMSPRVMLMLSPSPGPAAAVAVLSVMVSYAEYDAVPAAAAASIPDSSAPAAEAPPSAPPPPPPLPEVLVRCQGTYLQSKVNHCSGGGTADAAAASGTVSYNVELLELPSRGPGLLLVELRWGAVLEPAVPVLVLDDAAVASELQLAVEQISRHTAGGGDDNGGGEGSTASAVNDVDDLLLDLGAWLAHVSADSSTEAAAEPMPYMPYNAAVTLATHLLRHAEACGWTATATWLRRDLGTLQAKKNNGSSSSGKGSSSNSQKIVPAAVSGKAGGSAAAAAAAAGVRPPLAPLRPVFLSALFQALGLCILPPKEEAAYQAYAAPRVLSYCHVMWVGLAWVESGFRESGEGLLDAGNLTSLAGCAVGTVTAAAWPLLPRRGWEALVEAAKVPRYLAYMTAKLMIGWLGFPAPPGIVPYQLGSAMLVMEGVLLPFSCLLSPRAALVLALLKFPFGVAMMLRSGATSDPVRAAVLCCRVVLAAVATTVACHTYLRASYAAWVAAPAAAAAAGGGPSTSAAAAAADSVGPFTKQPSTGFAREGVRQRLWARK